MHFFYVVFLLFFMELQMCYQYIKEVDVKFSNMIMGLTGFITILIFSIFTEGNTINHLMEINIKTWLLLLHNGVTVSVIAHTSLFYLYKFYSVNKVMPFYSLFPIFGLLLTFFIFGEVPTLLSTIGGAIVIISVYQLQKIR